MYALVTHKPRYFIIHSLVEFWSHFISLWQCMVMLPCLQHLFQHLFQVKSWKNTHFSGAMHTRVLTKTRFESDWQGYCYCVGISGCQTVSYIYCVNYCDPNLSIPVRILSLRMSTHRMSINSLKLSKPELSSLYNSFKHITWWKGKY